MRKIGKIRHHRQPSRLVRKHQSVKLRKFGREYHAVGVERAGWGVGDVGEGSYVWTL